MRGKQIKKRVGDRESKRERCRHIYRQIKRDVAIKRHRKNVRDRGRKSRIFYKEVQERE